MPCASAIRLQTAYPRLRTRLGKMAQRLARRKFTDMQAIARAKLNLTLHITGRRDDGYHLMESLVAFAEIGDVVRVVPSAYVSLTLSGEFAESCGDNADNLVLRAARLLQTALGETRGAAIHLEKHLPVGAGLGGGSSDAATVCALLLKHWGHIMPEKTLAELLLPLGADMPMCVASRPLIARGIGEDIEILASFPRLHAVLVWPGVTLDTKRVYGAYQQEDRNLISDYKFNSADALIESLKNSRNMLQRAAIACASEVAEVLLALETLPQRPFVRMSGSGACCVAYFADADDASSAAAHLSARYAHWWVRQTVAY